MGRPLLWRSGTMVRGPPQALNLYPTQEQTIAVVTTRGIGRTIFRRPCPYATTRATPAKHPCLMERMGRRVGVPRTARTGGNAMQQGAKPSVAALVMVDYT